MKRATQDRRLGFTREDLGSVDTPLILKLLSFPISFGSPHFDFVFPVFRDVILLPNLLHLSDGFVEGVLSIYEAMSHESMSQRVSAVN